MEYLYVDFPINNPLALELAKWSLQENNRVKSSKLIKLAKKYENLYVQPDRGKGFVPKPPLNSKTPMLLNWTKSNSSYIIDCRDYFPNITMHCQKEVLNNVQRSDYNFFSMCRFYCEKSNKNFCERLNTSSPYSIESKFNTMCKNCLPSQDGRYYDVMDIANFIINYSIDNGYPINNMKLQKILFYVQCNCFSRYHKCMFSEDFIMWRSGAVIKRVWDEFKTYTGDSISKKITKKVESVLLDKSSCGFEFVEKDYDPNLIIDKLDKDLIKLTIFGYRDYSCWKLIEEHVNHLNSLEKYGIKYKTDDVISIEDFCKYYK